MSGETENRREDNTPELDKIKKIWENVYVYKCSICGRVLKSLYEGQLRSNIRDHKRTH